MGVTAVIKNVIKIGPVKTWDLYQQRKQERIRQAKMAEMRKKVIETTVNGDYADIKELFIEYLKLDKKGEITDKYYEKRLKSLFIKEVYPKVYEKE